MSRLRNISRVNIVYKISSSHFRNYHGIRSYATHKDHLYSSPSSSSLGDTTTSSSLSQRLNRLGNQANADGGSVGPFQLGMIPPSTKKAKRWDELSRGGKAARTAMRTTNFVVIVLGAGFSGLLVYALASELFAKNSPTVLYNEICERIKASPVVASHLHPPFTFHTHPPLTHRPRHRARHVNSVLTTDAAGREHLFLNFYIEGSDPSQKDEDASIFEKLVPFSALSDLTLDSIITYGAELREKTWKKGKAAFSYLVGEPLSSDRPTSSTSSPVASTEIPSNTTNSPTPWSLSWISTRLTGQHRPTSAGLSTQYVEKKYWKSGEVHVDMVKTKESDSDDTGKFVVRYIIISLPDSNNRNPVRLYVERTHDVSDHESVIRWSS